MDKSNIYEIVENLRPTLEAAARYIWENPELGGTEEKASAYYRKLIQDAGFTLHDIPEMPYAFYAEYGSGKPVVAILGEYDALPGLSQRACPVREPATDGAPGHGCGHNLIGAGAATAALAMKEIADAEGLSGTIRFYGCPEEELLVGKVKMVNYGVFDDVDYVLTWHPMCHTLVWDGGALANIAARFYFTGTASHAGAAPEKGRSALDAVEIMNVGVNYLREHVIDKARIHYTTNSGGTPPNVVHPSADSWYYIRAPHMSDVKEIFERVKKCAEGAAVMTETEVKVVLESGCCEIRPHHSFADLVQKNLEECPRPDFTDDELKLAQELQDSIDPATVARDNKLFGGDGSPMMTGVGRRNLYQDAPLTASTDGGDVSFVAPMHMFASACWPIGVAPHTWQATAANGSTLGEKGALYASKVMAGTVYDLLTDAGVREAITREFEEDKDLNYAPLLGE